MASATGIPERFRGRGEDEPLLGSPGDASQDVGKPIYYNLWIGTGGVAQAGIWVLTAIVWAGIFSNNLIFFSAHPILNSSGLFLLTQAALLLQPTHTAQQKRIGTLFHAGIVDLGVGALIAGLVIIEINKQGPGHEHFASVHAILGLITYIFLFIQAIVGFTQYFTPGLYGSVDRAKSIYKYHRVLGYIVLVLGLATIIAATRIPFIDSFGIKTWSVTVTAVLTLVGLVPRIKLQKLGLKRNT